MDINNFPDKNVSKKQLVTEYFPVFKLRTLDKLTKKIGQYDVYECVIVN